MAANASELQQRLEAATAKSNSLAEQHAAAQQEAAEQRAALEAQVAQLTSDNAEVRERLAANASELQQCVVEASEGSEFSRRRGSAECRVVELSGSLSGSEKGVEAVKVDRDLAVQGHAEALEAKFLTAQKGDVELADVRSQLEEMSSTVMAARRGAEKALMQVRATEEEAERMRMSLGTEILASGEKQAASRADLRAAMECRDTAEHEAEAQHMELSARVESVLGDVVGLRAQLEETSSERDIARNDAFQATAALEEAQRKLRSEQVLREVAEDELAQLKKQNESVRSDLADLQKSHEAARRRNADLAAQVETLSVEAEAAKLELRHVSEKAAALVSRLTTVYGSPSPLGGGGVAAVAATNATTAAPSEVAREASRPSFGGDRGGLVVVATPLTSLPASDAALVAEVRHRLREREEAMRLLAEGVELRERARPLERILAEKLAEENVDASTLSTAMLDGVVATAAFHRAGALAAREAQLQERAAQLKQKEGQLLRVAHELQAKSRALQAMYVRIATEEAEAGGAQKRHTRSRTASPAVADIHAASTEILAQLPPTPVTPTRAIVVARDEGSVDVSSPPPRLPPPPPPTSAATGAVLTSPVQTVEQLEEDTQERLAAATQAYRDVLFEHILETNGLQGCRSLTHYLPGPHADEGVADADASQQASGHPHISDGSNTSGGEGGLSDMARRTRAMLRALEERLGSARGPLRGVDPDVQKRSLEAFRKLEKAVRALCGASL
ncbi:hypothetical protein N2W54_001570 [Lotmaria passim]